MKLNLVTTSILTKLATLKFHTIFSHYMMIAAAGLQIIRFYSNKISLSLKYYFMQGGYVLSEVLLNITFGDNHITYQVLSFPTSFLVS